eukprot:109441-Chlamydomonas_euryale.AAC.2
MASQQWRDERWPQRRQPGHRQRWHEPWRRGSVRSHTRSLQSLLVHTRIPPTLRLGHSSAAIV